MLNWVVWMGNTKGALLHLNIQGYRWVCPCKLSSELLGLAPMPCIISPAGLPVSSQVTALTARPAQPYPNTHSSSGHPWSCPLGLDSLSLFGSLWEPAQLSLYWMRSTAKQLEWSEVLPGVPQPFPRPWTRPIMPQVSFTPRLNVPLKHSILGSHLEFCVPSVERKGAQRTFPELTKWMKKHKTMKNTLWKTPEICLHVTDLILLGWTG